MFLPAFFPLGVLLPPRRATTQDKYVKYIRFAKSIMKTLPSDKVPEDLADTHLFVKVCDIVGYQQRPDNVSLTDVATTAENGHESCSSMIKV